ncbi:MAG: peptidoglycan-binding protein [Actinomycetota bacterium]
MTVTHTMTVAHRGRVQIDRDHTEMRRLRWRVGAVAVVAAAAMTIGVMPSPVAAQPEPAPVKAQATLSAGVVNGLAQGSRGDNVRALQQALLDFGITVRGGADGIFGPGTKAGVEAFQASRGLPVTGVVDPATADAIAAGGAADAGSTDAGGGLPAGIADLARGAEGALVEQLQNALVDKGVWLAATNGRFDGATERGLRQFQKWNGLTVTGTINPATLKALGLDGSAPPTSQAPEVQDDTGDGSPAAHVGLSVGARGELVAELQRALMNRGINVRGGDDGVFGPATKYSLEEFQRADGRDATGAVTAADAASLGLGGSTPAAPPASSGFVGLAQGASGDAVKALQQALMDAGVTVVGGADGSFGPATASALRSYQQAQGLTANGTVDATTAERLGLGSSSGPQAYNPPADDAAAEPASENEYVGLRRGDSGPLVLEVQHALQRFGFVIIGGADGNFGPSTERTLGSFQSVNGIPRTGVVSERGARIMALGSGENKAPGSFQMERFPVQGLCFFGDTWHAPRGGGRLHVGTDLIADEGKLLYAVVDGEISKLYWDQPGRLSGNGLRLRQPDGTYFTYLHMLGFAPGIELGTKVKAGDVIGWVGNTGSSATAHLHFEIHPGGGAAINPYPYLKAMDECGDTEAKYQVSYDTGS